MDNWPLLALFKRAAKRVMILLNYSANRWQLASVINRNRSCRRRLSIMDRPGLLMACAEPNTDHLSRPGLSDRQRSLQRTLSYGPSEEEDVDGRAEQFISSFYWQIRMERQVSLELRYHRGSSFGSGSSP